MLKGWWSVQQFYNSYKVVTGVFQMRHVAQEGGKETKKYEIQFIKCITIPPLEIADSRWLQGVSVALLKGCEKKR